VSALYVIVSAARERDTRLRQRAWLALPSPLLPTPPPPCPHFAATDRAGGRRRPYYQWGVSIFRTWRDFWVWIARFPVSLSVSRSNSASARWTVVDVVRHTCHRILTGACEQRDQVRKVRRAVRVSFVSSRLVSFRFVSFASHSCRSIDDSVAPIARLSSSSTSSPSPSSSRGTLLRHRGDSHAERIRGRRSVTRWKGPTPAIALPARVRERADRQSRWLTDNTVDFIVSYCTLITPFFSRCTNVRRKIFWCAIRRKKLSSICELQMYECLVV